MAPFIRIALRYGVPVFALWFGMPEDILNELLADPEFLNLIGMVSIAAAVVIEGWYLWAKSQGGST